MKKQKSLEEDLEELEAIGGGIVMYGAPPVFPSEWDPPRPKPMPEVNPFPFPIPGSGSGTGGGVSTRIDLVGAVEPETADSIRKRIDDARIAELEKELRMHEAWKEELAILKRMRGDKEDSSVAEGGKKKRGQTK